MGGRNALTYGMKRRAKGPPASLVPSYAARRAARLEDLAGDATSAVQTAEGAAYSVRALSRSADAMRADLDLLNVVLVPALKMLGSVGNVAVEGHGRVCLPLLQTEQAGKLLLLAE